MMGTKVEMPVFDGEASETDSEENVQISFYDNVPLEAADKVKCQEIKGEDAESDSDNVDSISDSTTSTMIIMKEQSARKPSNTRSPSLLHHKLRESNNIFYSDLENVIKEFLKDNEKSLTDIDQHITKSQTIIQGASPSLKNFNNQSIALKNKLETLLTSNFLSNVKILE